MILTKPWGGWDGWAIWSAHAKFLCFPGDWKNMFSRHYYWSHPDYPLLVPSLIAMFWNCTGNITWFVPMVIAFHPVAGILILLYTGLDDKYVATFSVILLAADNQFISHAANLYADLWLAFFALFPLILFEKMKMEPGGGKNLPLAAGFLLSSALWVKNEGMVIFLLTFFFILLFFRKNPHQLWKVMAGALPVIITFLIFKIFLAPPVDLFRDTTLNIAGKLMHPERFLIIALHLSKVIALQFPLLPAIILFLMVNRKITPGFAIIPLLTFTVYLIVYMVTPYDVKWHLRTSLDRLIMQPYPSVVFLFSLTLSRFINPAAKIKTDNPVTGSI